MPISGAIGIPGNALLSATFSEVMSPGTLSSASFVLFAGTNAIAGTVSYIGVVGTFDPTFDLIAETAYTAHIRSTVTDLAGNHLAHDYVWSFTTGSMPDLTAPEVDATTPLDHAVDVALNAPITATFSEAMTAASITPASFVIRHDAATVPGTVDLRRHDPPASRRPGMASAASSCPRRAWSATVASSSDDCRTARAVRPTARCERDRAHLRNGARG